MDNIAQLAKQVLGYFNPDNMTEPLVSPAATKRVPLPQPNNVWASLGGRYLSGLQTDQKIIPNSESSAINTLAIPINNLYGGGVMAPTSDVVRLALSAIQGKNVPNYQSLNSNPVKLAYNLQGINDTPDERMKNITASLLPIAEAYMIQKGLTPSKGQPRNIRGQFSKIDESKLPTQWAGRPETWR